MYEPRNCPSCGHPIYFGDDEYETDAGAVCGSCWVAGELSDEQRREIEQRPAADLQPAK